MIRACVRRLKADHERKTRFIDFARRLEHLYRARIAGSRGKWSRIGL